MRSASVVRIERERPTRRAPMTAKGMMNSRKMAVTRMTWFRASTIGPEKSLIGAKAAIRNSIPGAAA